jgi:hypothetical protein
LTVPPSTPAGTYTVTYEICEILNPTNCDQAIVVVSVVGDPCVTIETYVYLEGSVIATDGTFTNSLPMRTTLNDFRVLPGQTLSDFFMGNVYSPAGQPYNIAPWNYNGTEGEAYDSHEDPLFGDAGYPPTVVDWVLVSLRDNTEGTGGPVCQSAALLHKDGTIEFVSENTCCNIDMNGSYYVVVEHRNHMIVMSHEKVPVNNGKITYDFRDKQSYLYDPFFFGIYVGQKEVLPGKFAMIAGNGDQNDEQSSDTDINYNDRSFWELENNVIARYRISDYNMNIDVNYNDRTLWEYNNKSITSVPRN